MKSLYFQLFGIWFLLSCSTNPLYDPAKPHHTAAGFRNLHYDDDKGLWAFLKWRWEKLFKDIPGVEDYHFPLADNDPQALRNNHDRTSLTWIGHATFLIQHAGLNILTDPQFSERASPVSWAGPKRVVAPGLSIKELPDIDAVLISHDHYDALDEATIRQLAVRAQQRPLHFLVPLGLKAWFDELEIESIQVIELDWGHSHVIGPARFTATPVQHWSKRSLFDAYERLWSSWVIEAHGQTFFFAGDTGYADHFRDIGKQYGPFDLALIPIGAYEPRWFMKPYHVNPEEAVMMHRDLRARYSVAMHWGTFILTDEPLDEPPRKLAEALAKFNINPAEFEVYQHGEMRFLQFNNSPRSD